MAAKRPIPGHSRSSPRWLSLSPRRVLTRGTKGAQADINNPAAKNTRRVAHAGPEERGAGEREEVRVSVTHSAMPDRCAFPSRRSHSVRLLDAKDQATHLMDDLLKHFRQEATKGAGVDEGSGLVGLATRSSTARATPHSCRVGCGHGRSISQKAAFWQARP